MRMTLLAAAAAFSIVTAAAHAENEGAGDPFPFSVPGVTSATSRAYADTGSASYPDLSSRPSQIAAAGHLDAVPANGSEGAIQTANSLPRGFSSGTVAEAQAQSVARFFAAREEHSHGAMPRLAGARRG